MKARLEYLLVTLIVACTSQPAFASGANLPWESPLNKILKSCTGPVAQAGGVIAILATGLGLALSEGGGLIRKCVSVVFGLSIAFSASSFIGDYLGYSGGVRF